MSRYESLSHEELQRTLAEENARYEAFRAQGLSLNMARGKPSQAQLDLSVPMLSILQTAQDCIAEDGTDCRNYGVLDGIPEAKRLMAYLLDDKPENVIVFGSSSLQVMYDSLARLMTFGSLGSTPWKDLDTVKWICPVPGYDRHFAVTEAFGIEMLPVAMLETGPDMNEVEKLASEDPAVKGIWCVPKYSNPSGITYSDEVVRRLASMETAARDFKIFWDNAYSVHHLYDEPENQDQLLDIGMACRACGNPDRYLKFASTSKITFPGAGISALAASEDNLLDIKKRLSVQTIGFDKLNQLRHCRFLPDEDAVRAHMARHAAILRPKFSLVLEKLEEGLGPCGAGSWTKPRGGYFVSYNGLPGTAHAIVLRAKEAGVTFTNAGATWPGGYDPYNSNIRIAPTLPPLEELSLAMDVFVCCARIATLEKLLNPES